MKRRLQFSLTTLLLLSVAIGIGMTWWHFRYRRWAAELAVPERRDAALYELLKARRFHNDLPTYDEAPPSLEECKVNHVVASKQPDGGVVYVVFKAGGFRDDEGLGKAKGHVIAIDEDGRLLPWYSGANVLEGDLVDVAANSPVHCIDAIPYSLSRADSAGVVVLYALPITRHLTPALLVAYNRYGEPETWTWRCVKQGNTFVIQLGPTNATFEPEAEYVWNATLNKYVGPDGGPDKHYMRLRPENRSEDMNLFHSRKPQP
jgi:hypothetical protein